MGGHGVDEGKHELQCPKDDGEALAPTKWPMPIDTRSFFFCFPGVGPQRARQVAPGSRSFDVGRD